MKKSLWMLGVAVAALASCTNEEVMQVAENRAIGFSSFVGNNTKAVTEIKNADELTSFYVFGYYGSDGSNFTNAAFNNELQTSERYWQVGNKYRFGAYADGNGGKIENVSFDPSNYKLTFTDYTPDDTKDLVAAVSAEQDATSTAPSNPVSLSFTHMLSQVKLTFTTDATADYGVTISNVQFTAVNKATGTYTQSNGAGERTIDWSTSTSTGLYEYKALEDGGVISSENPTSQSKLVIPQSSTDDIQINFTATITNKDALPSGITSFSKEFTGNLGHSLNEDKQAANTWKNQYRYNYTAKITLKDIINDDEEGNLKPIEFTPSLEEWKDASDTDIDMAIPGE